MNKSREEQLKKAEFRFEEANKLYREFVSWKNRVISFAESELYYPGMSKPNKDKSETPNNLVAVLCQIIRKPIDLKRQEKLNAKANQNSDIKLTEEAIIYLQARGKILGKDFSLGTAIFVADNVAFEIERNRILSNKSYHLFSFTGGDYCDESCAGWDGVSHRCDCGNSRVDWEFDTDHSFKNPSICAKAY